MTPEETQAIELRKKDEFRAMFQTKQNTRQFWQQTTKYMLEKPFKPKTYTKEDGTEEPIQSHKQIMDDIDEGAPVIQAIMASMINEATTGNVKAATFLRDTAGAAPVNTNLNANADIDPTSILTEEQVDYLLALEEKKKQIKEDNNDDNE